ncbi:xanthine dehydrogenase family protein molybdopterin-binding subunit [Pelagibius sp. Alg239-R121]|uniref:xanthine dehydrogenase family protein molybdopterin-binding subunit n=1 Tax=Pelagibius sp. Alg239-R121 TaxID=2993448 RepID=UPI0024A71DA2|nr:xanthine dehydrogenase family protein molybdopterin-binding subunit [Pelagibius sp. Alg239-R121]
MMKSLSKESHTSRRGFLLGASGTAAALVVGFRPGKASLAAGGDGLVHNPFVRITPDNVVTVIAKHFETGQGSATGLSTLVAEELDADWGQVVVEWAPADATVYNNLHWGAFQGTGGSSAIANSFMQYRKAGAAARDILVRAAAGAWKVPAVEIKAAKGRLIHEVSGRDASFGEMVPHAAGLQAVEEPTLKDPAKFGLIGKSIPRKDTLAKTTGEAVFALDVRVPGMVTAVLQRPPKFGGKVASFDASETMKVRGVVDVKSVERGVAVYAKNTWAAIKGREALQVVWDETGAELRGTDEIFADYEALAKQAGAVARQDGDAGTALAQASKKVAATFRFPYLAHAPMEPLNCVIRSDDRSAEVWTGSQFPTMEQGVTAAILGLKPEQVKIHTVYAGGSFGRRATPNADYVAEAAMVAKAIDGRSPVHLVWTREDDIRGGFYRPLNLHRVEAGIDEQGHPVGWHQRIVGQSILAGTPFEEFLIKDGIDATSVEGAQNLSYYMPNITVDLHSPKVGVPVLWWRSVGHTHTGYSTEVMIDMLAELAGEDPVEYRLKHMKDHPRHQGVLRLAAEKADWGSELPEGWARGVAVHESFNSYVAEIAEIAVEDGGAIRVKRIVCAVDCGLAINPDVVVAQMESGIVYGLGTAIRNAVTFDGGEVEQDNFPVYEPLRISEMPEIEVHIVASSEAPTGVGEPGTPPVAPAVANAVYAAKGERIFTLPFSESGVEFA